MRFIPTLATLVLVVTLGIQLAYWTWVFLAPAPTPVPQASPAPVADLSATRGLFGGAPGAAQPAMASNFRLRAVFAAASGRDGYAILEVPDRKPLVVAVGQSVAPGVSVEEIRADRVVLNQGGLKQSVALDRKALPPAALAPITR